MPPLQTAKGGFLLASFAAAILALQARAEPILRDGDRVAICGDSITEQRMYSVLIEDYLLMCQPVRTGLIFQAGWSGEKVTGLLGRLDTDIAPFRPTVVTTVYGMNDGGYKPTDPKTNAAFGRSTRELVRALKAQGVRAVVVGSPGAVDTETFKTWIIRGSTPEQYNQTLLDLGAAARDAARDEGAVWADIHTAMMDAMGRAKAALGQAYPLASDGVHPSGNGHLVMAYSILKALGLTGDIGTLRADAQSGEASASEGHKILSAAKGRIEVESVRYPFCFVDDPASPVSGRAMVAFVPFNEELNRLTLVLDHAPARVRVTWGGQSKVFEGARLQSGINLAAEFLDNPFCGPFAKVHAAVAAQQAYETPAIKSLLESMGVWRTYFPEDKGRLAGMVDEVLQKDAAFNEAARAARVPVRHVITWEAVVQAP